jgi:hypothetical protein
MNCILWPRESIVKASNVWPSKDLLEQVSNTPDQQKAVSSANRHLEHVCLCSDVRTPGNTRPGDNEGKSRNKPKHKTTIRTEQDVCPEPTAAHKMILFYFSTDPDEVCQGLLPPETRRFTE